MAWENSLWKFINMTNYINDRYFDDSEKQIPDDAADQFIKIQQQRVLNESEELKLRAKDSDLQASYAQKLLEYQSSFIANQPTEHRKTITRYGYISGAFLIIFLGFIMGCLYLGKDDFVRYFMGIISYIAVSALSFYFGKRSNHKKADNRIQEVDIIA